MQAQTTKDPYKLNWPVLIPHPKQSAYFRSAARFNVNHSGRRSGKTQTAKRKLIKKAIRGGLYLPSRYFFGAPTRDQAKRIYWDDLKTMVPEGLRLGKPREAELMIQLVSGSEIHVLGMDEPARVEGSPWDGAVLDEYGNMKKDTWTKHVRPSLSTIGRPGWCDFIGVPEGRNHYHELVEEHKDDDSGQWAIHHWPSWEILDSLEIESAKKDLDELTYKQEYGGEFISFSGRIYYCYDGALHASKNLKYDKTKPLIFCFDFNVEPGVAAVCQEQVLPNGLEGTGVIGEVWIPRNSNTPAVCRKLLADWGSHEGRVVCYGDATGGARGSAKVAGSDWELIRDELKPKFRERLFFRVPRANPSERSRVNAVNSRLKSAAGDVRMMIDPNKAGHVVRDLEGVRTLEGGSGEIDKRADPMLTHVSDGLGYYVAKEFPASGGSRVETEEIIL